MPGFQLRILPLTAAAANVWPVVLAAGSRTLAERDGRRKGTDARNGTPDSAFPLPAPALRKPEIWAVLAIMVLATAVRIPSLERGFSVDELMTARHSVDAESRWTTVSTCHGFNNHIGYSMSPRISRSVLGRREIARRIPARSAKERPE